VGAPDGFVLLSASDTSATPLLTLDYHRGSEVVPLWQEQATQGITWSLIWSASMPTADGLQPFTTVTP
jgi:hypothetical protein